MREQVNKGMTGNKQKQAENVAEGLENTRECREKGEMIGNAPGEVAE